MMEVAGTKIPNDVVAGAGRSAGGGAATRSLRSFVRRGIVAKADWLYEDHEWRPITKTLLTDGTAAMIWYRLMQWARRWRLVPLEMVFNKVNAVCCNCIIGRGAEFGPGLVLIHSTGVVINASVRGGRDVHIEHQVTIGAERRSSPVIGDGVFIGAGAKIIGAVTIGDGARVGANAVVVQDVPAHSTVVGIPSRAVRQRAGPQEESGGGAPADPRAVEDAGEAAAARR